MSTCNRPDLESLGSWQIMPKNFPTTGLETLEQNRRPMSGKNRQLVADEPVEFEK